VISIRWVSLSLVMLLLIAVGDVSSKTVRVGATETYTTIQQGIDALGGDGDTVLVAPGLYRDTLEDRNLRFNGISFYLLAEAGPGNTFIDVGASISDQQRFFYLDGYDYPSAYVVIEGFTIRNSYRNYGGGAIDVYQFNLTLRNCVFENNTGRAIRAYYMTGAIENCVFDNNRDIYDVEHTPQGGAINFYYSTVTIDSTVFVNNFSDFAGGALYSYSSDITATHCLFLNNQATERAGAWWMGGSNHPVMRNCTFTGNVVNGNGGALYLDFVAGLSGKERSRLAQVGEDIENCLIAFNQGNQPIYVTRDYFTTIGCTNIYGNSGGDWVDSVASQAGLNGNFSADPLFCYQGPTDAYSLYYGVVANSPCAALYNSCNQDIGAYGTSCGAISFEFDLSSMVWDATYLMGNPDPYTLVVSNSGGNYLNWTAGWKSSWLDVSSVEGDAPDTLTVTADATGLDVGIYYDTISFIDPNAENSPAMFPVRLEVIMSQPPAFDPYVTTAPIIPGSPDRIIAQSGETLVITFRASDPDGTIPGLGMQSPPANATFTDNEDGTATFVWSPVPTTDGMTVLEVQASDEAQSVLQQATVDINQAPSWTTLCGNSSVAERSTLECDIVATDLANPDGVTTTLSWNSQPPGATFVDNGDLTGRLTFTPTADQVGEMYSVTFTVDDGYIPVDTTIQIDVINEPLLLNDMSPSPTYAGDILVDQSIILYFNEKLNSSSVSSGIVIQSAKGAQLGKYYYPIPKTVVLMPDQGFLPEFDTISVSVTLNLSDEAGEPISAPYLAVYYTGATLYPGDANLDQVVDERDIFPIARNWGNTGPARPGASDWTFESTPAHVYNPQGRWNPIAGLYADTDGDGEVGAMDICAIGDNWLQSSSTSAKSPLTRAQSVEALQEVDEDIRELLLAAAVDCPTSQGSKILQELLAASLGRATEALPDRVELYHNYPNPFNPSTTIRFFLPEASDVRVEIFNMLGQTVAVLANGRLEAGYHDLAWEASPDVASGIYLYKLETAERSLTRRMMLLK